MATKITIDKAQKIDITAKNGDDFNLTLNIFNDSNSLISFTEDRITSEIFSDNVSNPDILHDYILQEDVLLFVVTTEDDTPVLAACSSQLDLAQYMQSLDTTYSKNYSTSTIQNDFDKHYTWAHAQKVVGISKVLAKYSSKNTEVERSNFGTNNLIFHDTYIETIEDYLDNSTEEDILNVPNNETESGAGPWFYSIFTNQESLRDYDVFTTINNSTRHTDLTSRGNNYIFWGEITGTNPFVITFPSNRLNLRAGSYKYTFKSLSDFSRGSGPISNNALNRIFRNVNTWAYGKLKINE